MSQKFENSKKIKVSSLSANQSYEFSLSLDADDTKEISEDLGLSALRKASFNGTLTPSGAADWALQAKLGATVVQPCVVSLAPVTTRIDEAVERLLLRNMPELSLDSEDEVEMPDDESIEPLGVEISLLEVFREALSLALPAYPRADGAEVSTTVFAETGVKPMSDDDARPFAGLAALKNQLEDRED
ncbi:DUF177 domain-containing protein [Lentibacter algarum]|uniref:YceD family protein n=1 Tax=Lentibacter algarum TaxID=576131 RepID=UPI001C06FE69|nr:DUF177 domain-containing protein [Lentibacter algarum]MBU2982200.1 DUF177 domain-containing protein [Lentibacter algarum]